MEYQAFVSVKLWTVLIQAANLLIITLVLKKLLLRPVLNIWNRRKSEVESIYGDAEREKAQAEDMRISYAEKLAHAKKDAEEMKK
ncbi:MAG: hypothetical protein IJA26_06370, partial [Clostridia bacterium]|nr:hypothetical protein [Clostridia bacterium]